MKMPFGEVLGFLQVCLAGRALHSLRQDAIQYFLDLKGEVHPIFVFTIAYGREPKVMNNSSNRFVTYIVKF